MREQKFRVWDKVDKRYYNDVDIEDIGRVLYLLNDYGHEYIIEQYIGLKDKNGKEVYDGDIIDNDSHICRIEWSELFTAFEAFNDYEGYESNVWFEAKYGKVIGNIHENPDLLKEKE